MSLDAPLAEGQPPSVSGAEISSLTNPITTPSCSIPGSQKSSSVSSRGSSKDQTNHNGTRRSSQNTVAEKRSGFSPGLSPKLTVRTPNSSNRNSLSSSINLKERIPSRGGTPKSNVSRTPNLRESPRLPQSITTPDPFTSRGSTRRSSFHSHDGDISNKLSPTNTTNTSLTAAVNQILYSRSSSRNCCHLCPNPRNCRHVCPDPRYCCHVCPRTPNSPASRDLRLASCNPHHQIEPYARSRKSDPQGYLFTCYLDYNRLIKPPPPACFDSYVRPESLQYSTCNSACESPRSSTSSSSFSLPGRRLYSRPPTPVPLTRAKEVHRIAMAGVPVDVKELANCYLFVAEIPGLKNTDVKVQVENDSILKISGERRREECDECEIKYIRVERQAGKFTRKFNLPANADLENITAACQDGLLSVVVPKNPPPEQRRPKNFEVKIAT